MPPFKQSVDKFPFQTNFHHGTGICNVLKVRSSTFLVQTHQHIVNIKVRYLLNIAVRMLVNGGQRFSDDVVSSKDTSWAFSG